MFMRWGSRGSWVLGLVSPTAPSGMNCRWVWVFRADLGGVVGLMFMLNVNVHVGSVILVVVCIYVCVCD